MSSVPFTSLLVFTKIAVCVSFLMKEWPAVTMICSHNACSLGFSDYTGWVISLAAGRWCCHCYRTLGSMGLCSLCMRIFLGTFYIRWFFFWISKVCQCHSVCGHYYKNKSFRQNNYVSSTSSVFAIAKILQQDFSPTCVNISEKSLSIWEHLYVIKHF